jgi:phosphopantetheinyl transferase (holo-ACP synthase)
LLLNHPLEISISHTEGYAAILLGKGKLGVDVQHYKPNVMKVRDRFLDEHELQMAQDIETTTLFWAAKEAIYKYNALPALDFRDPITIHSIEPELLPSSFIYEGTETKLNLGWRKLDGAMLVWTT